MIKKTHGRDGRSGVGTRNRPQLPDVAVEELPRDAAESLDIVEEAGKESFPASDAPPWTP